MQTKEFPFPGKFMRALVTHRMSRKTSDDETKQKEISSVLKSPAKGCLGEKKRSKYVSIN